MQMPCPAHKCGPTQIRARAWIRSHMWDVCMVRMQMEANLALADELLSVIRDKSVLNRFPVRSEAASFIERR